MKQSINSNETEVLSGNPSQTDTNELAVPLLSQPVCPAEGELDIPNPQVDRNLFDMLDDNDFHGYPGNYFSPSPSPPFSPLPSDETDACLSPLHPEHMDQTPPDLQTDRCLPPTPLDHTPPDQPDAPLPPPSPPLHSAPPDEPDACLPLPPPNCVDQAPPEIMYQ
ncbi:hypothetical protein EDC04DRAFT_2897573 [Pisolithus marmoratus]|nr:hypothetical protein EDC04DRAFT_2897573 [Pisolithus marmoratus]